VGVVDVRDAGGRRPDALSPTQRSEAVQALAATTPDAPLDVLIIGGGVVGVGAALDAAARGLSVGLVEMNDLAEGTSSRSSRLAHGGLRYLEQREFSLVHEALTERGLLLDRLAPHLVRPVPFLFPVARQWERPYVASGIRLYDLLSRVGAYGGTMPRPRSLTRDQAKALAPDLDSDEIAGAIRFHDAQIDDARHTVAVARTATGFGALIATRVKVEGVCRDGDRVIGVTVHDRVASRSFDIYARVVVGATGIWTDDLLRQIDPEARSQVQQSKGVHLVVPADAIRSTTAIIARTPASVLFLLPWGRFWLVGTTDTPWQPGDGDLADPRATEADIEYLLDQANRWLARPITREQVVATYAGLRPLLSATEVDGTTTLSREHAVFRPAPGAVVIAGGKYTTYRVMAEDVIDAAVAELPDDLREGGVPPSSTAEIPLAGADGFAEAWESRSDLAREHGLSLEVTESLLRRHGDRIAEVLACAKDDPSWLEPIVANAPYLRAEARVAVTHQGAIDLDDVLTRRLRVALELPDHAQAAVEPVAAIVAQELGWTDQECRDAIATYTDEYTKGLLT
jgi:glycerol-3-phosphate dehydrogenase